LAEDRELKAMQTTLAALQSLDVEERRRVIDWLAAKVGLEAPVPLSRRDSGGGADGGSEKRGDIKQFLKQKRPTDDVARATTLAYFLTHRKSQPTYKTADLSKARVDAALTDFNMSRAVSNAQRAGYLTTAGKKGMYQVTSRGEALVDAMPDAEAVKKVRSEGPKRRRKPRGKKRGTTKNGTTRS
jgi:hypothetical protein